MTCLSGQIEEKIKVKLLCKMYYNELKLKSVDYCNVTVFCSYFSQKMNNYCNISTIFLKNNLKNIFYKTFQVFCSNY